MAVVVVVVIVIQVDEMRVVAKKIKLNISKAYIK